MSQSASAKAKQIPQRKEKETRLSPPKQSSTHESGHDTRLSRQRTAPAAETREVFQPSYDEARQHLSKNGLLEITEACVPQTMATALKMLTATSTNLPADAEKAIICLSEVIEKMATQCTECPKAKALPDQIKEACLSMHKGLTEQIAEMERNLSTKLAGQVDIHSATGKIDEAIAKLDKATTEVEAKLTEVSGTASQIASKANSYKEALLRNPTPGPARSQETDMARVANEAADKLERQVLFEVDADELLSQSDVAVREKANQAINLVTSPAKPEDAFIMDINRVRKGALVIKMSSKEAANWLRHPEVTPVFTANFLTGAVVKPRQFPLIVPRIPLTFEPEDGEHLREVEESNDLPKDVIAKAKWIKPEFRRKMDQTVAHATFMLNDVNVANRCIRDGILICGVKVYPAKQKRQPIQCMKCRGWGHYANVCHRTKDICGTCGGEHRSSDCDGNWGNYCVSCKSTTHASWDRNCPEFAKRCAWYDRMHPENTLKFFPTDSSWTHEVRPEKIPFEDRFPTRFAVGSLPPPNRNGRGLPTRPIEKQPKHPKGKGKDKGKGKVLPGQTTIEDFLASRRPGKQNWSQGQSSSQPAAEIDAREEGEVSELFHSIVDEQPDFTETASAISSAC